MESDEDGIELVENKAIVSSCWYHGGELSTLIYFHRNCLGIGLISIPFEYILSITVSENVVRLSTCIDLIGKTVIKVDKVINIYLEFVNLMDVHSFRKKLYQGMLYCKDHGEYDKSVFSLKVVKRFFKRNILKKGARNKLKLTHP